MDSPKRDRATGDRHEQAAYWFAHLRSPEKTEADVRAFEQWLAASHGNRQAFEAIDLLWLKTSDLRSPEAADPRLTPNIHRARQHLAELKRQARGTGDIAARAGNALAGNEPADDTIAGAASNPPIGDTSAGTAASTSAGAGTPAVVTALPAARARHRLHPRSRYWAIAASLLLAVAVTLWLNPGLYTAAPTERHYTEIGEQKTIRLQDGTRITLNTRSTVDVAFERNQRRVILLRGQARFDVAPDKEKPFIVEIDGASVTALGTEFDIYKRQDIADIVITLLKGSVEVVSQADQAAPDNSGADRKPASQRSPHTIRLTPGQQVVVTRDASLSPVVSVDLASVDAWRHGKLKFDDTPLERAIAEANRYGGYQLVLANPELAQLTISGVFESGDNQGLANALHALLGVEIKTRREKIIEIH